MLGHLDPQPGERVLEIGTGTGWTAALLAHQLGDDHVVSVEVDPAVADNARQNLTRVGRSPLVVTADGAQGYPSTLWLLASDSWASVQGNTVRQVGLRRLFDEVIRAYTWWQQVGRPPRERYGVTVTSAGQSVWLDAPTQLVAPRD